MTDRDNDSQMNNYSMEHVAPSEFVKGWKIAQIVFGVGITLPVFWLGAFATQSIGFQDALWVFLGVNVIFALLSTMTAIVGSRSRLSTYMIMRFSFGVKGAKLINLIMAITLIGFYSATVAIFGDTVSTALKEIFAIESDPRFHMVWGSLMMTLTTIYGFKAMDKLSFMSVPLMTLFVCYMIYLATGQAEPGQIFDFEGNGGSVNEIISGTIGMIVLSIVLMPDYSRFAINDKESVISILGIMIGFPLVLVAGAIPFITTGETEIMAMMAALGITLPALFVLVFSTWTTNTANLYSSVLTLSTLFEKAKEWKVAVAASIISTILAIMGFMDHFFDFILTLSIVTPTVASIYVADFFLVRKQNYNLKQSGALPAYGWPALISWALSSAVSWATTQGYFTLTSQPTLDGLLVALVCYLGLVKVMKSSAASVSSAA